MKHLLPPGIPTPFPGEAERKAACRLLSNPEAGMDDILEPHLEATAERCRREPEVLAIQDTAALNYNGLAVTEGLAPLGGGSGTLGIAAHFCLAASRDGRPLGALSIGTDFRAARGRRRVAAGWTGSHGRRSWP